MRLSRPGAAAAWILFCGEYADAAHHRHEAGRTPGCDDPSHGRRGSRRPVRTCSILRLGFLLPGQGAGEARYSARMEASVFWILPSPWKQSDDLSPLAGAPSRSHTRALCRVDVRNGKAGVRPTGYSGVGMRASIGARSEMGASPCPQRVQRECWAQSFQGTQSASARLPRGRRSPLSA